jgi:hypothetical protein
MPEQHCRVASDLRRSRQGRGPFSRSWLMTGPALAGSARVRLLAADTAPVQASLESSR